VSTSTDPNLTRLIVHVRSLSRWTLATSLVLLSYLVVVVLQISWFVREEGWLGGELDAGFALGFGAAVLAFSLLFAIPAWFAMAASQRATQALQQIVLCLW
jgi:hypothetical protein